jgi:hypothetical protein
MSSAMVGEVWKQKKEKETQDEDSKPETTA